MNFSSILTTFLGLLMKNNNVPESPTPSTATIENESPVLYENTQVWRTMIRSEEEHELFRKLKDELDLSIWKAFKGHVDYLVFSNNSDKVDQVLSKNNFDHVVIIPDVQKKINASKRKAAKWTKSALRKGHRLNFKNYPSLEVINEYLNRVKDQYPSIATVSTIGQSVEEKDIKMIRISNGDPSNKAIVLVGGQHAREWISITGPLYIAEHILTKFDEMPDYMRNKDWYIIPVVNPDGYQHSQTVDRLWRKNRRVNTLTSCRGVDTNRNFPKDFRVLGVTQFNPCKEDYAGFSPLSEPESKALAGLLNTIENTPSVFIDYHSYGEMLIHPWTSTKKNSTYRHQITEAAKDMKKIISKTSGRQYSYGTCPELLYAATGSAIDYFHSKGVKYAFAIEGPDSLEGDYGFLLPPDQIESYGEDMLQAIQVLARKLNADDDRTSLRTDETKTRWF